MVLRAKKKANNMVLTDRFHPFLLFAFFSFLFALAAVHVLLTQSLPGPRIFWDRTMDKVYSPTLPRRKKNA
jgi:hypothetical protein